MGRVHARIPSLFLRLWCRSFSSADSHGGTKTGVAKTKRRKAGQEGAVVPVELRRLLKPSVAVFWDLDNKPPQAVPPYDAAVRLKDVATAFGEVVDTVAYANHHAFSHLPGWVREERHERKKLDALEKSGVVKPQQPYICGVCGAKKKTNVELKKHFKSLHEREQRKRMNRLDSLRGGRRVKYLASIDDKSSKFRDAARSILVPKLGYGLAPELRRAGFLVRTVADEPQAADMALKRHMRRAIDKGVNCICLVSDDSDFADVLHSARQQDVHTVVVGETKVLRRNADVWFSWQDVASGAALAAANDTHQEWMADAGIIGEVFDLADHGHGEVGASFLGQVDKLGLGGLYYSDNDEVDAVGLGADAEASDDDLDSGSATSCRRPWGAREHKFLFLDSSSDEDNEFR